MNVNAVELTEPSLAANQQSRGQEELQLSSKES